MAKNILILVGGGVKHTLPFDEEGKNLGLNVTCASFAEIEYTTDEQKVVLKVKGKDVAEYDVVYLRVVGKRFEDAALIAYYCRQKGIRLVDRVFESDSIKRIPVPKSIEVKLLQDAGIPIPRTYFGRTRRMLEVCPELFGFPFVIKGTTGKQGNEVWSPRNMKELKELVEEFTPLEKKGKARFLAQEFIKATQRNRIFVIGGHAIAGITRPTRWRKRFIKMVNGEYPEGIRTLLDPIPQEDAQLAVRAAAAVGVEVGGVDVLTEDESAKKFVLEVNSAPRWAALKKDTGINIERKIMEYLSSL